MSKAVLSSATPRRMLFVFEQFRTGGFETHLDTLIAAYAGLGVEVFCASGDDFSQSLAAELVQRYVRLDFADFTAKSVAENSQKLAELIEAEAIDFIHLQPFLSLLPGAIGACLASRPFAVTFHGVADLRTWTSYFGGFFGQSLAWFVLPAAASITCVSELGRDSLAAEFGLNPPDIGIIRNPIDLQKFRFEPRAAGDRRMAVFVSRLDDDKFSSGLAAMHLFGALAARDERWRFAVAGAGNTQDALRQHAEALGVRSIEWLGHRRDVAQLMVEADAVIGTGRVVLEGAAIGRPAVVAGYDGLVGILTPERFDDLQRQNFAGRDWPTERAEITVEGVHHAIARSGHASKIAVRSLIEAEHDACKVARGCLAMYERAGARAGVKDSHRQRAQAALEWLESAGNSSLRDLSWMERLGRWPAVLLGSAGHGTTLAQARLVSEAQLAMLFSERHELEIKREAAATEVSRLTELERKLREDVRCAQEQAEVHRREREGIEAALFHAESVRRLTLARCHNFRTRFEDALATYRAQRAWKVMIAFRKAYHLLASRSIRTLGLFCRSIWRSSLGRACSDMELQFPSIDSYMPSEMMQAFTEGSPRDRPAEVMEADGNILPLPKKYDVIVLAIIDFDFRFQRPQQIAAQFARNGHRVFWISPTRYLAANGRERYTIDGLRQNLWEVRLRGRKTDIYGGSLDNALEVLLAEPLAALFRDCGVVESAILVQIPFWTRVALALRKRFGSVVIYDCMDDWDVFPGFGKFNVLEETTLARNADQLIVTAENLARKFEDFAPLLVRNGCDFEFFNSAKHQLPKDLDIVSKPVIGYFGAIADWVDLDLVHAVASVRPSYSFVLIGQVFGGDVSRLESLNNVHLLGHREYATIPGYLRGFDACIIPFMVNDVTRATDPVKLYEYFCAGKPVVSTKMPELDRCGDLVLRAADAAEFVAQLDRAVGENDPRLRAERMEFARENSWSDRFASMNESIRARFRSVSILIVTHNSREFIEPCIRFLLRNTTHPRTEIIVVDNASEDGTQEELVRLRSSEPSLQLHFLDRNLGFSGANNVAAKHADGDYLVFLNADTIVSNGWLERLLRHCRSDPKIGLIGAVTNFAGNEVKINFDYQDVAGMEVFAQRIARERMGENFDVAVAPLFCALMPAAIWWQTGGLDERYECGMFEDDDLAMEVRAAGYRVAAASDCFVHHFGQGSFAKLNPRRYEELFQQNRSRFEAKWGAPWQPHRIRPGVRGLDEDVRFEPSSFCRPEITHEAGGGSLWRAVP